MADEVPQWAIERAKQILDPADPRGIRDGYGRLAPWVQNAFARYIAEHEEPPVDPLLLEAREIAAGFSPLVAPAVRDGNYDGGDYVRIALAALKRGMELAREQS